MAERWTIDDAPAQMEKEKARALAEAEQKVVLTFEVTKSQMDKINTWAAEIDKRVAKEQVTDSDPLVAAMAKEFGSPYYGAIGGELSFKFIPTSMGVILVAHHSRAEGEEKKGLNVTDYDSW